jgi:hypothetical protein
LEVKGRIRGAAHRQLARARHRRGIPVVLAVDIEPDPRLVERDNPEPWEGFVRFAGEIPALRELLRSRTGISPHFTWLIRMDPQIAAGWGSARWAVDTYGELLAALTAAGDELGLHVHTWRWDGSTGNWVAEREDSEWVAHCTRKSLDTFEGIYGRAPRVASGGDRFTSPTMLSLLAERGVCIDLTVAPGEPPQGPLADGERTNGLTPDYSDAPGRPYRPRSFDEFTVSDAASEVGLTLMPLLSAPQAEGGRAPLLAWSEPAEFRLRLQRLLAAVSPPVLTLVARTDLATFHPQWDWFVENLEEIARHPQLRAKFMTASEAAAELDGPAHQPLES